MNPDPWLERWLPVLKRQAGAGPVLELGCGPGADTATLAGAGLKVVALDLSAQAVAQAQARTPAATFHVQDLREPFPLGPRSTGAVIASLSLHYFPWAETRALFARIAGTLQPGGMLLCRLNSTEDVHFGAQGHPELEPGYFLVEGQPKRFFDRAAILALMEEGWIIHSLEHHRTDKYGRPKALWELACNPREAAPAPASQSGQGRD